MCCTGILTTCHPFTGVELVMTDYTKHKKAHDDWYCTPFYTGPRGYKLCLKVVANYAYGLATHVSVWLFLMRGEYDDCLVWPFRADITVQLVNQWGDQDHHERTLSTEPHDRVTSEKMKLALVPGMRQFISHNEVEYTTGTIRYLKNDCLVFRVTRIVVHSLQQLHAS